MNLEAVILRKLKNQDKFLIFREDIYAYQFEKNNEAIKSLLLIDGYKANVKVPIEKSLFFEDFLNSWNITYNKDSILISYNQKA